MLDNRSTLPGETDPGNQPVVNNVNSYSLLRAYATARYRALVEGCVVQLRVGCRASALESILGGVTQFGVITAANPGSIQLSDTANQGRDLALLYRLDHAGARRFPAENDAPDGSHREPSWLICDLSVEQMDQIAFEFGQTALLAWVRGHPVALRTPIAPLR